jgi:hypothetical protein
MHHQFYTRLKNAGSSSDLESGTEMTLSRYSVWMGIGCGLAGLAISAFAKADTIGNIKLQGSLPANQAATLKADRVAFTSFKIPETNTDLKTLLGTSSNSAADLDAWLEARVQVIVGQSYDISSAADRIDLEASFDYPNPGLYPTFENAPSTSKDDKTVTPTTTPAHILMSNFGVSTYYTGKASGRLLGLVIDGVGTLPVHSPLVGAIQIGDALFDPAYFVDKANPDAAANSILRLGTFFHEAHHSDGNGKSMGFFHAICPPGHTLAGLGACDRTTNGAYTVGAQIMKALTESCTQCTRGQIEALRLQYTDSFGRVLPYERDGVTPIHAWDAKPEGQR